MCIFIEMLFKNETTESHPARNPCELQCCERYYTVMIHTVYTQQALRRLWLLHSDRWFCSKAFPGSTHELCRPHPESREPGWPLQTIKSFSLLLRFFHLLCFNKTILSQ